MFLACYLKRSSVLTGVKIGMLTFFLFILSVTSAVNAAEPVWNGDFSTGDFRQYHHPGSPDDIRFWMVPEYGRPIQYGKQHESHVGDGSLLSLVAASERTVNGIHYPAGPTRGTSEFSAKFTIKNSVNGLESSTDPSDCDIISSTQKICERRRTQLKMQATHPDDYDAIPHMGETWIGFSHYLPDNFWLGGGGFGIVLFGIKHRVDSYSTSGPFRLELQKDGYKISHSWYPDTSLTPQGAQFDNQTKPWQYVMHYTANEDGKPYPRSDFWPLGLRDFPNEADSITALKSVNLGGWTDWVFHWIQDHRGSADGGRGILEVWKREDSGPWIKVLNIEPKITHRGDGKEFDHGIGYNHPPGSGSIIGMYGGKTRFWNAPNNQVIYFANHKIFGADGSFADVSPDGSEPGDIVSTSVPDGSNDPPKPMPPVLLDGQE